MAPPGWGGRLKEATRPPRVRPTEGERPPQISEDVSPSPARLVNLARVALEIAEDRAALLEQMRQAVQQQDKDEVYRVAERLVGAA